MTSQTMPLDISALITDTQIMGPQEFGAYVRLLCAMWSHKGWVPDSKPDLLRITGVHPPHWPRVWATLRPFLIFKDNQVSQKRLLQEIARASRIKVEYSPKVLPLNRFNGNPRPNEINALTPPKIAESPTRAITRVPESRAETELNSSTSQNHGYVESSDRGATNFSLEPSEEPAPKKVAKRRATRLPENWTPDLVFQKAALQLGMPENRIQDAGERMRDWSLSAPNGIKLNWLATWRNWVKRDLERSLPTRARGSPEQPLSPIAQALKEVINRERPNASISRGDSEGTGGFGEFHAAAKRG